MTAPAATLIQRLSSVPETAPGARAAANPGPDTGGIASFAAHLDRETPGLASGVPIAEAGPAPGAACAALLSAKQSAAPAAAAPGEAAIAAAPGKTLQDKRQVAALAAAQAVVAARAPRLGAAPPAATEAPHSDARVAETAEIADTTGPLLPDLAALLVPAQNPAALPPAAPSGGSLSARFTSALQPRAANSAPISTAAPVAPPIAPAIIMTGAPTAETASHGAANPAEAVSPAVPTNAFALERDIAAPGSAGIGAAPVPADAAGTGQVQGSARAEPSTLAVLTGAPTEGRPALRKARAAADAAIPGAKAGPADMTTAALLQAQPFAAAPPLAWEH